MGADVAGLAPTTTPAPRLNAPEQAEPEQERQVTERLPGFILEIGQVLLLAIHLIRSAVRPPFSWGREFVYQLRFTVRACLWPLMLTSFALAFGPIGVQASGFFEVFGTFDRLGSVYELTEVRWFAPLVVGIVLAGAAGTAMCADLGARVVRDEISALVVAGVDPIKTLVLPRVVALLCAGLLFYVFAVLSGLVGAVLVLHQHHEPVGPAMAAFFANATPLELSAAIVKLGFYGLVVALVSCHKGITVSGGPEGVGRAVNQSVVIAFVTIGFIDYVFTQLLLATHPVLSQVRG
jgi:phospholipid/cholesterol/gamma-HCH transport system permease protein